MNPLNHGHDIRRRKKPALLFQDIFLFRIKIQLVERPGSLIDHQAAKMERKLGQNLLEVLAIPQQLSQKFQNRLRFMSSQGSCHTIDPVMSDQPQYLPYPAGRDRPF